MSNPFRNAAGKRRDTADSLEIDRIINLPLVDEVDAETIEAFCSDEVQAKYFEAGFRLFGTQVGAILAYDLYGGGFFPIGVGWGKCVCSSTEIFDVASGRRRSVTELGELVVPSMREHDHRIQSRRAVAFESGQKPCVRLSLRHGQQMELSTDHKVYTKRGWVEAANLTTGDKVATPCTLPHPERSPKVSDHEVILASYLMADGSMSGGAMAFTQMPGPVLDEFQQVVKALGGTTQRSANDDNCGKAEVWHIQGMRPWKQELGLEGKAVDKRLPADWYGLSDHQAALFLSRFWACDGWLEKDRASVCLANRLLVEDIRHLLLLLGITSRVEYEPVGKFTSWRLVVSGGSNLTRFRGALGEIPGKPWGELLTHPSKAVEYDGDLRWVSVASVEPIGMQRVYDQTVPETHNFLANGMVVHNTLITLMIANRSYLRGDSERSVLFVPPQVYEQLLTTDIPWARQHVGLQVPFHFLGGRGLDDRRRLAASGKRGCYILPYSLLSTRDSEALLGGDLQNPPPNKPAIEGIRPDLLILDEAHSVKNPTAARTQRLRRYMNAHQPALVALSGTITSKSINDYHHLIAMALKHLSPLPQSDALATNWSFVLDPEKPGGEQFGSRPATGGKTGPLTPLVKWARKHFPDEDIPPGVPGFRKAYKLRLTSTPGVVATGDAEIGVSLTMCNDPVPSYKAHPDYPRLKELMDQVEELWLTPSGDEIEHGFNKWRYLNELTAGFYYKLRWPTIEELERKGLSPDEAELYLELALEHHEAKQEFSASLRKWIQYKGRPGMDTPLLVTGNMGNHQARDVGKNLYGLWSEMKSKEFEDMPVRISEPVRICDYKIMHAVRWAQAHAKKHKGKKGAIIWVHHREPGAWLFEELQKAGIPAVFCPSESHKNGSNAMIRDPKNADKIIVASITGHGTGKNLQHFEHQLFVQFPRQADTLEQVLGRTHRNGQQADALEPSTMNTTDFDHQNLWACLIDSLYIHQTTGSRQKAIYASYNPLPRRFPTDFLRERGFADVKQLDREAQQRLVEKFGE